MTRDREKNRLGARVSRYARVGTNVGGVAAKVAGARLMGRELDRGANAAELAAALGGLKGPLMKVAQLLSTIPDALPAEYAMELAKLQSDAPPMGWAFVKRRMAAELGADWRGKFDEFGAQAAASASLGQVGVDMAVSSLLVTRSFFVPPPPLSVAVRACSEDVQVRASRTRRQKNDLP